VTSHDNVLKRIKDLPAAPDVAHRLMRIVRDPDYEADDLLSAVEVDPSITSLLLKTVNSSFIALRQPVGSLRQAIVLLGGKKIVDLVLALTASDMFTGLSGGYILEQRGLWQHSVAVAAASEAIATRAKMDKGGMSFTAGLLHDLGKIVLNSLVEESAEEMGNTVTSGRETFLDLERQILGTDHCEMGGLVGEKWNLPEPIVHAIRNHHTPEMAPEGESRDLTRIVHAADVTCMTMGIGLGLDGMCYDLDDDAMRGLGLDESALAHTTLDVLDRLKDVEEFLKL
jgi:putative nucleotidyltransferase with HDIG domain